MMCVVLRKERCHWVGDMALISTGSHLQMELLQFFRGLCLDERGLLRRCSVFIEELVLLLVFNF